MADRAASGGVRLKLQRSSRAWQSGLALLACFFAACAQPTAQSGAPGSAAPSAAPAAAAAPRTLIGAVGTPIIGLSPIGLTGSSSTIGSWFELHSNGLATSDAQGRPIPRIARELPSLDAGTIRMLDDGRMTSTWTIRSDVTWHDGTPFTAADLAFGYRVHSDTALPFSDRTAVQQIVSAEALDPQTLLITWKGPFYLADALGPLLLYPLPAHLLEAEYDAGDDQHFQSLPYWLTEYVHTGPYRLASYESGVGATFQAYDGYFLGRPKISTIVVREALDVNSLIAGIMAGDVQMTIDNFTGQQAATLFDQYQGSGIGRVVTTLGPAYFIAFQFTPEQVSSPALLDPRIRQALYYALDRSALANLGWGGRLEPRGEAKGIFAPSDPLNQVAPDIFADSANDPTRAAQLFAAAGWTRSGDGLLSDAAGDHLPIGIRVQTVNTSLGAAAADIWKSAGVDALVDVIPAAASQDRQFIQSYSGTEFGASGQGDRIFSRYDGTNIPTAANGYSGGNRSHYNNPDVTALILRYRLTLSPTERNQLVAQIAGIAQHDLPLLPVFWTPTYFTVGKGIQALDDVDGGHTGGGGYYGGYPRAAYLWTES